MSKKKNSKNKYMLKGKLSKKGYDWWWHSFTAKNEVTKEEKAFYIEYYITNPALSPNKVILGQSSEEAKPSYFMMNVGTWGKEKLQIHEYYPTNKIRYDRNKNELKVGQCFYSETRIAGKCSASIEDSKNKAKMTDAGTIEWELSVNKLISYNVGYGSSRFFRFLNAFEMFWHAEGIKTEYIGHIVLNGEKYIVDKNSSYGYADKNWGKDFTSPWLWISSCNLRSIKNKRALTNSAIELGGGRPKAFGIPINRKILIMIYYEGKKIEFNFSKFWKHSRVKFDFSETESLATWNVLAKNRKYNIVLSLECNKEEMLEINYEAPNGKKLHNHLLNGGTGIGNLKIYDKNNMLIDNIEFKNAGCEYGEYEKKA